MALSLASLLLALSASQASVLTGPITNPANGHQYLLISSNTWPNAEAEALALGGHLVTVNDAAENAWVLSTFGNFGGLARPLWIGLNDLAVEGTFVWVGGDSAAYRNWAPGEPNNGGGFYPHENYVALRGPGLTYSNMWNDVYDTDVYVGVVEVAPNQLCFDAAANFSTNSNPNGAWSYGFSTTLGGSFIPNLERGVDGGLVYWRSNLWLGDPAVFLNPSTSTKTNSTGTVVLTPGQLAFHPGPSGEFCLVRFTTPSNGVYQISSAFAGADTAGTTTDVHILKNGATFFNGIVSGFGPGSGPAFNTNVALVAGDRLDFAVGRGADNDFSFDSTALAATICWLSNAPVVITHGCSDVATDFSTNSNPNGVWSYGYSTTLGGSMTLHPERGTSGGFDFWRTNIWLGTPTVSHNPANVVVTNGTGVLQAGGLLFHPGPNGEFCLIRFTTPSNGVYQVSSAFAGADTAGTTTDVHIMMNGSPFFNGVVNGFGAGTGPTFTTNLLLLTGDRIDFAVGRGADNDFSFDSTALAASICWLSNAAVVVPPTIVTQPTNKTVIAGSSVTFDVAAIGDAPLRYQWRFNGTNLLAETNTSLTLLGVQSDKAGNYSVVVTNAGGTATSSNALLTVLPPPSCTPVPLGIVSWWRAESNALDSVDGNNGVLSNGVAFATGEVGSGFSFDGVDDYIQTTTTGFPTGTNNRAIECWVKIDAFLVEESFIAGYGNLGATGQTYGIGTSNRRLYFSQWGSILLGPVLQTNQWYHVAVSSVGNSVALYLDGTNVASGTLAFSTPAGTPFYIGKIPGSFGDIRRLRGTIDELTVYNRNLSASEILGIYNASSSGKCGVPPFIVTQPVSQKVTVGSNVTFNVVADGTPQLRYQWRSTGTNLPGATGSQLSFTVNPDSGGPYSVRVTNAFGSVISSNAILTVNFVPVARTNLVTTPEDTALPITLGATDANNDPLTYTVVTPPSHGTLTGSGTNRVYTPDSNYNGQDGFTFKVNDGMVDSAPATVAIVITPVNDAPIAYPQTVALDEDMTASIALVASDVDNDPLAYTVGSPEHGSLTGSAPNLVYHPNTNYNGPDSFTFSVSDGATNSNVATVSITVRPVNDAPVARITVSPLTQLLGITNNVVVAAVCADGTVILDGSQSSDVENDPLTYAWSEGTNSLGSDITVTNQFAPGTHEVTLTVSDGHLTGTASATVEVVTPAQAVAIIIAYVEDASLKPHKDQPLTATLRAAAASFDRCNIIPGVNQLQAFQNKTRAQVAPFDPALADKLIEAAQQVINVVGGD